MQAKIIYYFGEYTFDPSENSLVRSDGLRVELGEIHFKLLEVFVENPLRQLSTEKLKQLVYPDTFVEQETLERNVRKLKKELRDNDEAKREYIKAVRGRGYRFIVEVDVENKLPNPLAVQNYKWGRRLLDTFTTEQGLNKAIECFQTAYQLDPDYFAAYSGEADAYIWLSIFSWLNPETAISKAQAAVKEALKDDNLAEAHASQAYLMLLDKRDWEGAEKEFKRAIELEQKYRQRCSTAYQGYAI
jgi:DNA-binding winged helix-turn-helix (wHTH) protein